jgi:hypothetical protein
MNLLLFDHIKIFLKGVCRGIYVRAKGTYIVNWDNNTNDMTSMIIIDYHFIILYDITEIQTKYGQ